MYGYPQGNTSLISVQNIYFSVKIEKIYLPVSFKLVDKQNLFNLKLMKTERVW